MELGIFSGNVPVSAFLSQQQVPDGAFAVDNWAISRRIVRCRETTRGRPGWATGVPCNNWPRHKHISYCSSHENKCSCSHWSAGGVAMEMMLDSGSAVSLVRKDMMSSQMNNVTQIPLPAVKLVTAAGDDLLMIHHIQTTVQIQHHTVNHTFVVVNTLITLAILRMDFLQQHGIVIDFASIPVKISLPPATENNTDPIL